MANQPKKYKKFVATAATATLVASAIVPVASAKSFSDVAETNEFQPFIDALSDSGIINGYADGTFKPGNKLTRGQVVKMLGRWVEANGQEVPADWETVQRFNDVPVSTEDKELVKYAALVKEAGVFTGSNGNLSAANNITRQQMAKVLNGAYAAVNGVSLVDLADSIDNKLVTDLASAQQEFEGYIQALVDLEISTVSVFRPSESVTRAQFAKFLYNTINLEATAAVGVKAINNTTVEVTFDEPVVDVKALKFTIEGLEVKNAAVKQTDANTVVLTTATQEGGKVYTVKVDGEEIGTFTGIEAIVPTTIKLLTTNTQAKVGNEVTLKADVGVKAAGIPVTFNIDAPVGSLNKDQVIEVLTDAEGIATLSYTQYSPEADDVTVYPTGAPQLRAFGTVYWGQDNILTLEEVTTGNVLANGIKKTYKVTFKDPKTGVPLAGRNLNVSFVENTDVAFNSISKATVTNPVTGVTVTPYQTTTGLVQGIEVTTDSNGQATFIVSGTNTSVTPYVFVDGSSSQWFAQQNVTGTTAIPSPGLYNDKWEARELSTTAATVKFEGAQLTHQITVERNGEEEAAANKTNPNTRLNGREYTITVKDKDGKAYAGGVANIAFDEVIDKILTTNTTARLANVEDSSALYGLTNSGQQGFLKLDGNGQAKVVVYGADDVAATPIVWIDQNVSQNYQTGVLEEGEPVAKGAVSNFQYERVIAGKLTATGASTGTATYAFTLTNQSAKNLDNLEGKMSYEIRNTGANDVWVTFPIAYRTQDNELIPANTAHRIAVGGSIVASADVTNKAQATFTVTASNSASSVSVVPTFVTVNGFNASNDNDHLSVTAERTDARDYNKYVTTDAVTATFTNSSVVTAPFTGYAVEYNPANTGANANSIWFEGKNPISYAGSNVEYYGANGNQIFGIDAWEAYLASIVAANTNAQISYSKDGDKTIFKVISTTGSDKQLELHVAPVVNNAPTAKTVGTQTIAANGTPLTFTASQLADDVDAGDVLTILSASTGNATIATASLANPGAANAVITLAPGTAVGTTTVTAVVADSQNETTTVTFNVTVTPAVYATVIGNPARSFVAAKASVATLVSPTVTTAGNLEISDGTTTETVNLAQGALLSDIATAINTQASSLVTAAVVGSDVVITSKATGVTITTDLPSSGAAAGNSLAVTGTNGAAVAAQYTFKVGSVPTTATTFKVAVGSDFYEYTSTGSEANAGALATAIQGALATKVAAGDTAAVAFNAKYAVTVSGDVITVTQKTATSTSDTLSVTTR